MRTGSPVKAADESPAERDGSCDANHVRGKRDAETLNSYVVCRPQGDGHSYYALRTSFAANAPSKPSRKGSEYLSASKRRIGVSARMRRTTSSFSSGSTLHVL